MSVPTGLRARSKPIVAAGVGLAVLVAAGVSPGLFAQEDSPKHPATTGSPQDPSGAGGLAEEGKGSAEKPADAKEKAKKSCPPRTLEQRICQITGAVQKARDTWKPKTGAAPETTAEFEELWKVLQTHDRDLSQEESRLESELAKTNSDLQRKTDDLEKARALMASERTKMFNAMDLWLAAKARILKGELTSEESAVQKSAFTDSIERYKAAWDGAVKAACELTAARQAARAKLDERETVREYRGIIAAATGRTNPSRQQ
jgi:hypothetical protein